MGKLLANAREINDPHKIYTIKTKNGKIYKGKMTGNHYTQKILEFETDDNDKLNNDIIINYSDIVSILEDDGSEGGKRINYSTKKSKNRRHASRRRRTAKKNSGGTKHSRRRRA